MQTIPTTSAWAVVEGNSSIYIDTISGSARASMISYLLTEARAPVMATDSDQDILLAFVQRRTSRSVQCRVVKITAELADAE